MWRRRDKGTEGRYCRVSTCKFVIDVGVSFGFDVDLPGEAMAVRFSMRHVNVGAIWIIDAGGVDKRLVEYVIILILRIIISGSCKVAGRIYGILVGASVVHRVVYW